MIEKFSLTEKIQLYNENNKTQYNLNNDFGFKFFNAGLLVSVNKSIEFIKFGFDDEFFTIEERQYVKERQQYYKNYRTNVRQGLKKPESRSLAELPSHFNDKCYFLSWRKFYQAQYNDENNWLLWKGQSNNLQLDQLQTHWKKQQAFSLHTHDALVKAFTVLAVLEQHHQQAKKALITSFTKLPIPDVIYFEYYHYLTHFQQAVIKTHQQMIESMLTRLSIWQTEHNTDTILYFHKQLKKLGFAIKTNVDNTPCYQDFLLSAHFQFYHQAIIQYGSPEQKIRLRNLPWFKQKSSFPTVTIETEDANNKTQNTIFLVPESLKNWVPLSTWKPKWLFKGHYFRQQFFKDRIYLIAKLQEANSEDEIINESSSLSAIEVSLNQVRLQESIIQQAIQEGENQRLANNFTAFFQQDSLIFIAKWLALLTKQQTNQVQIKISIAEKLLHSLLGQESSDLEISIHFWQYLTSLQNLLHEIDDNVKTYSLEKHFESRIEYLLEQSKSLLNSHRLYSSLKSLAEDQLIAPSELNYLLGHTELLAISDTKQYQQFLNLSQPTLQVIFKRLSNLIKQFSMQNDNKDELSHLQDCLLCLNIVMQKLGSEQQKQALDKKWQTLFLRYLTAQLQGKNHYSTHAIMIAEQTMQTVGKTNYFLSRSLQEFVIDIKELQIKSSTEVLNCHCLAIAIPLAKSLLDQKINRDLSILDENLRQLLATVTSNNMSIQSLFAIRTLALSTQQSLEQLPLSKAEKNAIEINQPVKILLESSIAAHQSINAIQQENSLQNKLNALSQLQTQLKEFIPPSYFSPLLRSKSGARLLFTQSYLRPEILAKYSEENREDTTPISRTLN